MMCCYFSGTNRYDISSTRNYYKKLVDVEEHNYRSWATKCEGNFFSLFVAVKTGSQISRVCVCVCACA